MLTTSLSKKKLSFLYVTNSFCKQVNTNKVLVIIYYVIKHNDLYQQFYKKKSVT